MHDHAKEVIAVYLPGKESDSLWTVRWRVPSSLRLISGGWGRRAARRPWLWGRRRVRQPARRNRAELEVNRARARLDEPGVDEIHYAVPATDSYARESGPMTAEDIDVMARDFASAARRAVGVGADLVEIHMGHGHLLGRFLSPYFNRRAVVGTLSAS